VGTVSSSLPTAGKREDHNRENADSFLLGDERFKSFEEQGPTAGSVADWNGLVKELLAAIVPAAGASK
jgi:hypothetical protein